MSGWRENLGRIGVRLAPGAEGLLAWWRRSLLAWLPPRWRAQLGLAPARLLLWRAGDDLHLARQLDTRTEDIAQLPWPQSPGDIEALLGPRLSALPRTWLLAQAAVLRRTLRLPAAAAERLRDVVRFEIDRQTPFAADQVDFDVRVLERRGDGQLEVELVVVPHRTVEELLASIDGWAATLAGIDVAGVDAPPLQVNLLPPARRQHRGSPLRRWQWALAALALLVLVLAGGQLLDNRRQAAEALRVQVDASAQRARGVAAQRQQLVDMVEGAAFFERRRAARPTATEVWDELSRRLPDGSYLEKFAIEGDQLQLIGLSREASSLVGKLEGSPLWHTPSLTGVLQGDSASRGERFTLTAQLATAPAADKEAADGAGNH